MEGRCAVEIWADLGLSGTAFTPKLKIGFGTDVFLCTGSDEVYVFNTQERKLTVVLKFPGPVSDLVASHNKQLLYVSCRNGVYCVCLPYILSRTQSSSSPAELSVSSEYLVIGEEGDLSLLLIGSGLLVLSHGDTSWVMSLYKTPKEAQSSSYEKLSSFSLPLVSAVVNGDANLKTGVRRRPVLLCVRSAHTTSSPLSSPSSAEADLTDSHFHLEPVLFKLLFGIDSALINSPVILCGLPDGRLCFLPLRLPGSKLRILHSLEQPIIFVGGSIAMETDHGHAQCLVAVGELGRVVLIRTDEGRPDAGCSTAVFTEGCVPGPVVCSCVAKDHLYYSTGSDLLVLDLTKESSGSEGQERDEETSKALTALFQSPTSLNVCRVIDLTEPTCSTTGEIQLLGLSVRGQLQRITLPLGKEEARLSKLPSAQVGRSVKDLLSAIEDVCERASVLKTSIKSKNQILRHLNHVLNISFLLTPSTNSEEHLPIREKPIRCHATARWSRLLQKDSLHLTCVLDNSSPYVLEQGWTLSIAVFPLSCSLSAGGESSSTSFSFPIHNLHPGETLEVSLPLAAAGDTSFPMTVNCSLIFSLTNLLGEEELVSLTGLQSNCISLPLNTLIVDWLHALRVNSPTASRKESASQFDVATDAFQAFLKSHPIRCSAGGESVSKQEKEQYSASVWVSSELVKETLEMNNSDHPEPKSVHQSVCISVLDWLLSEGHGGVNAGYQKDRIAVSSSVVNAQGPNGDTVKLTVKEVNVGEQRLEKDDFLPTVDVRVESTSLAAVCGLHHAVLSRVQTLLQSAPDRTASTKRLQSLGLRQALQRAERLLQQIQQRRISETFGVGVSTGQVTMSLLSVYRELRENPLPII